MTSASCAGAMAERPRAETLPFVAPVGHVRDDDFVPPASVPVKAYVDGGFARK